MKKISKKLRIFLDKKSKKGVKNNTRINAIKKLQRDPGWHLYKAEKFSRIAEKYYENMKRIFKIDLNPENSIKENKNG